MRFIVDAQLPLALTRDLAAVGHDVTHTSSLPLGNRTPDEDISALAAGEDRIVITKDSDFVTTFLLRRIPPKLLLVSTGNIANDRLELIVRGHVLEIAEAFESASFVELGRESLTVHE